MIPASDSSPCLPRTEASGKNDVSYRVQQKNLFMYLLGLPNQAHQDSLCSFSVVGLVHIVS